MSKERTHKVKIQINQINYNVTTEIEDRTRVDNEEEDVGHTIATVIDSVAGRDRGRLIVCYVLKNFVNRRPFQIYL